MKIEFPYINNEDLEYMVDCLLVCRHEHAREYGFNYPYFAPGGAYGAQWWQIDSSLALSGYKWIDREFCERALLNFIESQKEDGRICLWGADALPSGVAGGDRLCQTENVSSLPKLFDVTYHVLRGTSDRGLKEAAYSMLRRYLDWWFAFRMDKESGLFTAVFEETFIPYLGFAGEYAPVDTNAELYAGCHYTELLALELGKNEDAHEIGEKKLRLKRSINKHLWNDDNGAYFAYFVKEKRHFDCFMASSLFPLRFGIAEGEHRAKLIELLQSAEHFNWGTIPLTSVSMKDPAFTTTIGKYKGNASWSGNVWTLINETVVRGLLDCGERELAAELALSTLRSFNRNCAEFINPFDGSGHGVIQYAWTASQCIELIVETIFGISIFASGEVTAAPSLTDELKNSTIALREIALPNGKRADVTVDRGVPRVIVY